MFLIITRGHDRRHPFITVHEDRFCDKTQKPCTAHVLAFKLANKKINYLVFMLIGKSYFL